VYQIKTFDSGSCSQNNVIRLELTQTRQRDILQSVRHTRWCLTFPRSRQQTSRYKLLLCQFWSCALLLNIGVVRANGELSCKINSNNYDRMYLCSRCLFC